MKPPIKIGERVVVNNIFQTPVHVSEVTYIPEEARWIIILDWGEFGKSKVYDYDEGKIWFRWLNLS